MGGTVRKITGQSRRAAPTVLDAGDYTMDQLNPHKDHFHLEDGRKAVGTPGTGMDGDHDHTKPPSEEDVVVESVKEQRKSRKRGVAKTSTLNTMLQSTGGASGHRLG